MVDTGGTGKIPDEQLTKLIRDNFELTPKGIIRHFNLISPIYRKTAAYGHFGRELPEFTWEKTDKVNDLKKGI